MSDPKELGLLDKLMALDKKKASEAVETLGGHDMEKKKSLVDEAQKMGYAEFFYSILVGRGFKYAQFQYNMSAFTKLRPRNATLTGIVNAGAVCYFNTLIQVLKADWSLMCWLYMMILHPGITEKDKKSPEYRTMVAFAVFMSYDLVEVELGVRRHKVLAASHYQTWQELFFQEFLGIEEAVPLFERKINKLMGYQQSANQVLSILLSSWRSFALKVEETPPWVWKEQRSFACSNCCTPFEANPFGFVEFNRISQPDLRELVFATFAIASVGVDNHHLELSGKVQRRPCLKNTRVVDAITQWEPLLAVAPNWLLLVVTADGIAKIFDRTQCEGMFCDALPELGLVILVYGERLFEVGYLGFVLYGTRRWVVYNVEVFLAAFLLKPREFGQYLVVEPLDRFPSSTLHDFWNQGRLLWMGMNLEEPTKVNDPHDLFPHLPKDLPKVDMGAWVTACQGDVMEMYNEGIRGICPVCCVNNLQKTKRSHYTHIGRMLFVEISDVGKYPFLDIAETIQIGVSQSPGFNVAGFSHYSEDAMQNLRVGDALFQPGFRLPDMTYQLVGVALRSGEVHGSGHYKALVWSDGWYIIDDNNVGLQFNQESSIPTPLADILRDLANPPSTKGVSPCYPTLLLYSRVI